MGAQESIWVELLRLEGQTDRQAYEAVKVDREEYPAIAGRLTWDNEVAGDNWRVVEIGVLRRSFHQPLRLEDGEVVMTRSLVKVAPDWLSEEPAPVRAPFSRCPRVAITLETALAQQERLGPPILREARSAALAYWRRFVPWLPFFREHDPQLAELFDLLERLAAEGEE